jgi:hypothetical protein
VQTLAFLPLPVAVVATSMTVQNVLLKRVGPRPLMTFGLPLGAGGMAWLAQPTPTGVASAMVNTMQQLGGAVGASALSTIFASAVSSSSHTHVPGPHLAAAAAVHGYTTAFWVSSGIFAAEAILIGSLVPGIKAPVPGAVGG